MTVKENIIIGRDDNKEWFVYSDKTDKRILCDSKDEAEELKRRISVLCGEEF